MHPSKLYYSLESNIDDDHQQFIDTLFQALLFGIEKGYIHPGEAMEAAYYLGFNSIIRNIKVKGVKKKEENNG